MSAETEAETATDDVWMQLEWDRADRCFYWQCSCGWSGESTSLYRATPGVDAHLRACRGEKPTMLASRYRPEEHRPANPDKLPKYEPAEGN